MTQLTGYMHGVNLGGWLSQCNYEKTHCDTFITEDDIKVIKSWGMDHVRVPVDYNMFQDKDGKFIDYGFAYVDNCIQWCKNSQLNMILDLHKTVGYSFDAGEKETGLFDDNSPYQAQFLALWEEFTKRYAKFEDMLSFELLNEVTDKSYSKAWNALAKKCVQMIRKSAPTIKILIGSYWNNSVTSVKDLDAPYDENIIYNFHCYDPLIFTHQGAPWVGPQMNLDFRMPYDAKFSDYQKYSDTKLAQMSPSFAGFPQDKCPDVSYFETLFAETLKVAEERKVRLYCGEYGVIDRVAPEETLKWYKDISATFNKYGIGRAAWSYKKMDFGISDTRLDGVRPELLKLL